MSTTYAFDVLIPRRPRPLAVSRARQAMLAGVGCLLLSLTCGCATSGVPQVKDLAELDKMVATSQKPLVMDFYKEGCAHCNAFETTLRGLGRDYSGKITTAKFLLMKANGECTAPAFAEKHDIALYPTVIIYVNGKESKRFIQNYTYSDYSVAIDEILRQPTTRPEAGSGGRH